ncbi:MAG: MBL fold metallo-hydrolase [Acidimicrobiales bacterium]|nr:MBL fold metallo-hydrolase [Acidimicrobiales bacterium]
MAAVTFLGAVGSVTGSKFLLESETGSVLVDCGLYQGPKDLRKRNWDELPLDLESLDSVVVTHAHVDHIGYTPRLVGTGFSGPIHATTNTVNLARIILPDSGHIHEEEAKFANKRGYSKHHPALPLYTEADARKMLPQFQNHEFGEPFEAAPGIQCSFRRAGHILGSASVLAEFDDGKRVVVSGDLGPGDHPLLLPAEPLPECDVVLCESTYGNRPRPDLDVTARLGDYVEDTISRGGVVLIPAFAVDRTEIVLWHLAQLQRSGRIPRVPVYLDSPMASAALAVYREAARSGAGDLRDSVSKELMFEPLEVRESRTVEDSKALNRMRGPLIIISASGMATGGRILHHLASRLGSSRNSVILVGFQAPGTRGRALADGAQSLKFFGSYHPVRASVHEIGLSAHADQNELVNWLQSGPTSDHTVFTVHGEEDASASLAAAADAAGLFAVQPRMGERILV